MVKPRFGLSVLVLLGLVVVLTYLATATGLIRSGGNLLLALVFAIGPVAMAGMVAIYERLSVSGSRFLAKVGVVFLVVAFAFFNLMLVVQQLVRLQFRQMIAGASEAAAQESLRAIYRGVNLVQQGMDVSFDIFYCMGTLLLGMAMFEHRDFGKVLGILGAVLAGLLLVFNLWTFPYIPADSGLVDLGPLTGLWWLAVIIQFARLDWRDRRTRAASA